jgi:hypothetical protein
MLAKPGMPQRYRSARRLSSLIVSLVMPGLVPGIHVLAAPKF